MKTVEIRGDYIELYKLLKFEALASSGAEAKTLIAEGQVSVNGVVETRKRKKLALGDTVTVFGDTYTITAP